MLSSARSPATPTLATSAWSASQANSGNSRAWMSRPIARPVLLRRRAAQRVAVLAQITEYGVPEDRPDGTWMQTFGFPAAGGKVGREMLTFSAGSEAVPVTLPRPLGIIFEEQVVNNGRRCVVAELAKDGNAEKSGEVAVGDILRVTTAVAKMADKVSVGRFQVEPSLGQRQQGGYQLAYFVADGQPFNSVMGALTSFSNPVDADDGKEEIRSVSMLLERPAKD